MNAKHNMKSDIERHLNSIPMSERDRDAVLHDALIGELFADAVVWVCRKFASPESGVFAKPSPKY